MIIMKAAKNMEQRDTEGPMGGCLTGSPMGGRFSAIASEPRF